MLQAPHSDFPVHRELPTIHRVCSYDTETYLMIPGDKAPPIVAGQFFDGEQSLIVTRKDTEALIRKELYDPHTLITGFFVAFDMMVTMHNWPYLTNQIFRAYDQSRIRCSKVAEELISIARGVPLRGMGLAQVAQMRLGIDRSASKGGNNSLFKESKPIGKKFLLKVGLYQRVRNVRKGILSRERSKLDWYLSTADWASLEAIETHLLRQIEEMLDDTYESIPVRYRYADVDGLELEDWPMEFQLYGKADVEDEYHVMQSQQVSVKTHFEPAYNWGDWHVIDGAQQSANDFALQIAASKGFMTDPVEFERIKKPIVEELEHLNVRLIHEGLLVADRLGPGTQAGRDLAMRCQGVELVWHMLPEPLLTNRGYVDAVAAVEGTLVYRDQGTHQPCGVQIKQKRTAVQDLVARAYSQIGEGVVPRTDPTELMIQKAEKKGEEPIGNIKTSKEVLEDSGDPVLSLLARRLDLAAIVVRWFPTIGRGFYQPIHTSFKVLVETGRTASTNFNVQNQPRKHGIRNCFIPFPGYYFCSVDYSSVELRTLAQVCLWSMRLPFKADGRCYIPGTSKLVDTFLLALTDIPDVGIRSDPHCVTGAELMGISLDEYIALSKAEKKSGGKVAKTMRQGAKGPNFGIPGGLGAEKLAMYTKNNYGVYFATTDGRKFVMVRHTEKDSFGNIISKGENEDAVFDRDQSIKVAGDIIRMWKRLYEDVRHYMNQVANQTSNGRVYDMSFYIPPKYDPITNKWFFPPHRRRGSVYFNNGCNGGFQGLAADGGKRAFYELVREAETGFNWRGQPSVLHGAMVQAFIHDEAIVGVRKEVAHEQAMRIKDVMVEVMQAYCPDVPILAEPAMAERWYKEMEPVFDEAGKLIPWKPKK